MNWKNLKRKASHLTAPLALAAAMTSPKPTVAQDVYFGNVPVGQSQDKDARYGFAGLSSGKCFIMYDSLTIIGQDANDFQIISDGVTGHSTYNIPLIATIRLTPSHPGVETAKLVVKARSLTPHNCIIISNDTYRDRSLMGFGMGQPLATPPIASQPQAIPTQPDVSRVYIFIEGAQTSSDNINAPVRAYLDNVAKNSDGQSLNGKYDVLGERDTSNVKYATHNDKDKIKSYIQTLPQDTEVYLVGHSWGGYIATQIAADKSARNINGLVTIDPVDKDIDSSAPSDRKRPPMNITRANLFADAQSRVIIWVDVDATLDDSISNAGKWDRSDSVAYLGGDWGTDPKSYATQLLLNDTLHPNDIVHHADFYKMMRQVQLKIIQPKSQQTPQLPGP